MIELHDSPSSSAFTTAFKNRKDQKSKRESNSNVLQLTPQPISDRWKHETIQVEHKTAQPTIPRSITDPYLSQSRKILPDSNMELNLDDRKDLEHNLENRKSTINEKEDNETSGRNPRTCSEAVGMEKLIPSLRQRQQIDPLSNNVETRNDTFNISNYVRKNCDKNTTEVSKHVEKISKPSEEETNFAKTSKKKSKMKSTFNTVFRSLRSKADRLLTNSCLVVITIA